MAFVLTITPTALRDIAAAVEYYNDKAENLGYRFADLLDDYFIRIATVPTVSVLRIFNTYQEPLW